MSISALYFCESTQALNCAVSRPSCAASCLKSSSPSRDWIPEQPVVKLPELALLGGALRRFGRRARPRMDGQRVMAVDEMDPVAVGIEHLVHGRKRALTERALEIRELDDLDRRALRTLGRAVRLRDDLPRRIQHDARRDLRPLTVHILLTRGQRPLLDEEALDREARLIERGALQARLVLLEPRRRFRIGRLGDLRRNLLFDHLRRLELAGLRVLLEQRVLDQFFDGDAPRFEQRLRQLHGAEIPRRLLQRLLVHLSQRDGGRSDRRDDFGGRRQAALLRRRLRASGQQQDDGAGSASRGGEAGFQHPHMIAKSVTP